MMSSSEEIKHSLPLEHSTLITNNIVSIIGHEELTTRDIKTAYWGVEPTEEPSLEILIAMMKIKDLIDSNIYVMILLADVHSFLNKDPSEVDQTDEKIKYYRFTITTILSHLNVNPKMYEFIKGSDIQLDKRYIVDLFKFMSRITVSESINAGKDVLKQQKDPCVSKLVYPLMQVLDETVIDADLQLGSESQRQIMQLSRDYISGLGYKKCIYLLYGHVPLLQKISSDNSVVVKDCKIYVTDTRNDIARKINSSNYNLMAVCMKDNPCMSIVKYIVYPWGYTVGGHKLFDEVLCGFVSQLITEDELKQQIITVIDGILSPIRDVLNTKKELWNNAFVKRSPPTP